MVKICSANILQRRMSFSPSRSPGANHDCISGPTSLNDFQLFKALSRTILIWLAAVEMLVNLARNPIKEKK